MNDDAAPLAAECDKAVAMMCDEIDRVRADVAHMYPL